MWIQRGKNTSNSESWIILPQGLFLPGSNKGKLVFDNCGWLIRGSSYHMDVLLKENWLTKPVFFLPVGQWGFILGNRSVNVDKLSQSIYSKMCSFLKLPFEQRICEWKTRSQFLSRSCVIWTGSVSKPHSVTCTCEWQWWGGTGPCYCCISQFISINFKILSSWKIVCFCQVD